MEQYVRVTLHGPALAVLCFAEWMHIQGTEHAEEGDVTLASDGTVDIYTQMAELWVELPLPVVYGIVADGPALTATLQRIAPEYIASEQPHTATYLLRLELPNR